jgi:hypothetical protein
MFNWRIVDPLWRASRQNFPPRLALAALFEQAGSMDRPEEPEDSGRLVKPNSSAVLRAEGGPIAIGPIRESVTKRSLPADRTLMSLGGPLLSGAGPYRLLAYAGLV